MKKRTRKFTSLALVICLMITNMLSGIQVALAETETSGGMYLGMDTNTQGAWNGKYGASGYHLVGQNGTKPPEWGYGGSVLDPEKYQIDVTDLYVNPSYVTNVAWADGNFYSPSPDDHSNNSKVLDLPAGTVDRTKYKAEIESAGDPLTVKVNVNDYQQHIFTTYTSTNWGNGAAVQLLDEEGNLLATSPYIPAGDTFGNGAYVSFMVQGSFQVRFADTGGWASMAGFFFDEPSADVGVPAGLSAQAAPTGRTINLTWTNNGDYSSTILERSTNNINFLPIATFTGGETGYTDENLTPFQTYYYRLRNVEGNKYGIYTDSVSAVAPPDAAAVMNPSAYLGINTAAQGAWNGIFGASGYHLVGQNGVKPPAWGYGGSVLDSEKYQIDVTDLYVNPSYVTSVAWADGNSYSPSPDDHSNNSRVLDLPAGTTDRTKYKAEIESAGDPLTVKVNVNDSQPHIFTTYTSTNWGNGATVQLLDEQGNLLAASPYIPAGDTFGNGAYVSFMVQGSFQVRFADTGGWASMAGFFFDEPSAAVGVPAGLNAQAAPTGRTIDLTWTNAGDYSSIVLERSTNNINFSKIAAFTNQEAAYTDTNLSPSQTYYYRLRNVKNGQYGVSTDSVNATVPPMTETRLEITGISAANVSAGDSVTVSSCLTESVSGSAISGTTVYLKLTGSHVGDGETLGQEIPELLGSAVTTENGTADITFEAQYAGSYGIVAYTLPDDNAAVNGTASEPIDFHVDSEPAAAVPTVFKLSDAVKPGGLFTINGSDIKDNSSLKVWIKENTDGIIAFDGAVQAEIVQKDKEGRFAVAKLPANASAGVFNVWVENDNGISACYQLNAARPLYISDYEIYTGIEIELVGRNFKGSEFNAADNVKVRLNNGSTYDAIINTANTNPYKIAFTIGSDVPVGEYFVEASNDGGRNWSRLANGQTLAVVDSGENPDPLGLGVAWARDFNWEDRFDVTDYGATGNDTSNDTSKVQAAVDAAAANDGGGVVYFPDGSYYIDTITLPAKVVLLGQSREGAKLYYTNEGPLGINFINSIDVVSGGTAGVVELQGVADLSLLLAKPDEPDARPDSFMWLGERWGDSYGNKTLRRANRIFVQNVKIDYPTDEARTTQNGKQDGNSINGVTGGRGIAVEFIGDERILIQDNHFAGYHAVPYITGWNQYYLLKDNYFEYTFGYIVSLASYFFAEGNHVEAVHSERNEETHGIFGRDNAYMEGNFVKNVGAKDNSYNDGEPLCVEVPNGYWNWGSILKGTADSITVAPKNRLVWPSMDYGTLSVLIVEGRGQGQLREVKLPEGAYPAGKAFSGYTIKVTEPFDVVPDHTSKFTLIAPNKNATFYDNEVVDNAKGIWLFGNSFDGVIADNTSIDSEGIFLWSDGSSTAIVPDYYSRIVNNDITGVSRRSGYGGIGFNTGRSGGRNDYFATDVYSTEILNNKITGGSNPDAVGDTEAPSLNGIYAWAASSASAYDNIDGTRDAANTIVVGNELDQLDTGVHISHSNYGAIIKGNTYSDTVSVFLNDTHTITDRSVSGVNVVIEDNYSGTVTPEPTSGPTTEPTAGPTTEPTAEPTTEPTTGPTAEPTSGPTTEPTSGPTTEPTSGPTIGPTTEPTPESVPVTIVPAEPAPVVSYDAASSTVSAKIRAVKDTSGGAAKAKVDDAVITELMNKAKLEKAGTIAISLSIEDGTKEVIAELSGKALKQLYSDTKASIRLDAGTAAVTFDAKAVAAISNQSSAGNITVGIRTVDNSSLSKEAQKKIGDRPVYDFTVKAGNKELSQFGNGKAEISISYTLKSGEKKNCVIAFYIDKAGKLTTVNGKYEEHTGTVKFKVKHFSRYGIGYNKVSFKDVKSGSKYEAAIEFLAARGIVGSTKDGRFSNSKNLTKADFLVMAMRAYGMNPDSKITNNFADGGNKYYTPYLATAKRLGIVKGVNNKFTPEAAITKQDMLLILYRILYQEGELQSGSTGKALSGYSDAGEISKGARKAVKYLIESGMVVEKSNKLNPKSFVSKEYAAQILYALLTR